MTDEELKELIRSQAIKFLTKGFTLGVAMDRFVDEWEDDRAPYSVRDQGELVDRLCEVLERANVSVSVTWDGDKPAESADAEKEIAELSEDAQKIITHAVRAASEFDALTAQEPLGPRDKAVWGELRGESLGYVRALQIVTGKQWHEIRKMIEHRQNASPAIGIDDLGGAHG